MPDHYAEKCGDLHSRGFIKDGIWARAGRTAAQASRRPTAAPGSWSFRGGSRLSARAGALCLSSRPRRDDQDFPKNGNDCRILATIATQPTGSRFHGGKEAGGGGLPTTVELDLRR